MKVKRYKKIRKILQSYRLSHNLVAPYKVVLDGELLQAALQGQVLLREQLPKLLQEERTSLFVTPCVTNWLRKKGTAYGGALHIATTLAHLKCRHDKGFVRPFECIKHLLANGNPDRLLVCAQDEPIRKLVRHTAGVPLLFLHGATLVMEGPTDSTKDAHAAALAVQGSVVKKEERIAVMQARKELKEEASGGKQNQQATKKKKRKGPSQPNPLSVKKKKKNPPGAPVGQKKAGDSSSSSSSSSSSAASAPPAKKQKLADSSAAPSSAPSSSTAASSSSSASSASSKKHGSALPAASSTSAAAAAGGESSKASRKRAREKSADEE